MANRYWIGGTGNWGDSSHWSASSGGSGGASVPTSSDNVYFDVNSFGGSGQTVTVNATANCLNMDWTGTTKGPTLAGSYDINVYGSLTLIAGMTVSHTGIWTFKSNSTATINLANKTLYGMRLGNNSDGSGTWSLQSNLTITSDINFYNGSLVTNNYNISAVNFKMWAYNNCSVNLGSSVVTLSGSWGYQSAYTVAVNAGTSTIKITGDNGFFCGSNSYANNYWNLELSGNNTTIYGSNAFNDLKLSAGKTVSMEAKETQTISTLSGDGASGNLITIQSTSAGSAFTLSKSSGTVVQKYYYSIKDCTATGGATWRAANSTNVSGNTGWFWGQYLTVADSGSGAEAISLTATIGIVESHLNALQEYPMAVGMGYAFGPAYDTCQGLDGTTLTATINAGDGGYGNDAIGAILAMINTNDLGRGLDFLSAAKAFYFIDPDNILQPLGVFVMRGGKEELLPRTRDNADDVVGRHGELDFGTELQPRIMEFKVHINTTPEEKTVLKRTLAAYLNPLNGAKGLIDSRDMEKTYYVKYAGNIDLDNYVNALQFTIPFKATDPIIYGSFEQTRVGSGTISNDGTLECPLKITISGAVTNPSVTVGSKTLTYAGTLGAGDELVIDTGAITCKLNGVNAVGNLSGLTSAIKLQPGDTVVTAASAGTTIFSWREMFV